MVCAMLSFIQAIKETKCVSKNRPKGAKDKGDQLVKGGTKYMVLYAFAFSISIPYTSNHLSFPPMRAPHHPYFLKKSNLQNT